MRRVAAPRRVECELRDGAGRHRRSRGARASGRWCRSLSTARNGSPRPSDATGAPVPYNDALSLDVPYTGCLDVDDRRQSAVVAAWALLETPDVLLKHRRELLSIALWKYTEAEG